jgi:hypothetical protein
MTLGFRDSRQPTDDCGHNHHEQGGVYRGSARAPCTVCQHPSVGRCVRCQRAFCIDHLTVSEYQRCPDCELQFAQRQEQSRQTLHLVVALVGTLGALGIFSYGPLALLAAAGAMATVAGFGNLLRTMARQRFLAEGRHRPVLDEGVTLFIRAGTALRMLNGQTADGQPVRRAKAWTRQKPWC